MSASSSRGVNERHFHRERIVKSECFIGIEFGREGLEVRIQTLTSIFEFFFGEGIGLHCEMKSSMIREGVIVGNLSIDGASEGLGDFMPEILLVGRVTMLLKVGIVSLFVDNIFPITPSTHRPQIEIEERFDGGGPTPCHDEGGGRGTLSEGVLEKKKNFDTFGLISFPITLQGKNEK